jgi:hypothetical protein
MERFINRQYLIENTSDRVYHFTHLPGYISMCRENTIYLQSGFSNVSDIMDPKRLFYLSLSRNKSLRMGFGSHHQNEKVPFVRIEFDGRMLNADFRVKPVDYWGGRNSMMGKQAYYKDEYLLKNLAKEHGNFEYEDRLFSNKEAITPASRYIRRVDIFIPEGDKRGATMLHSCPGFPDVKTCYYTSLKEFSLQSENYLDRNGFFETLNPASDYMEHISISIRNKEYAIEYFGRVIAEFFDNPSGKINELLRSYRLERFSKDAMKGVKNTVRLGIRTACESLANYMHDISREPDREGSLVLRMIHDFVREMGFTSWQDVEDAARSRNKYRTPEYNKRINDRLNAQYEKLKDRTFTIITVGWNYCLDPDTTDFWELLSHERPGLGKMPNDEKQRRIRDFIQEVYYLTVDAHMYDDEPARHKSKDDKHFWRYLVHLSRNHVTASEMVAMLERLGILESMSGNNFGGLGVDKMEATGEDILRGDVTHLRGFVETDGIDDWEDKYTKMHSILMRRLKNGR